MNFSIVIPTFNNFNYLKLSIDSIRKNSFFKNQIIIHINGNDIKTENYLNELKIEYTKSDINIGLCSGVNMASKKCSNNYFVYAHDDMYFLPKWDFFLYEEIKRFNTKLFYLSSTQISHIPDTGGNEIPNHIYFNAGDNIDNFDEKKLLDNYEKLKFYDLQGSHWAPHVIHRDIWNRIGGFSEEFNPGFGSDPDLNMKLWKIGVRIFKGVNQSRIYHFGSLTTRKNKSVKQNNSRLTFLLKWKITMDFFIKFYLKRGRIFNGPLSEPSLSLSYLSNYLFSKLKYYFNLWKKN
jgi:GT2 family glycosyltransferase